MGIKHIKNFWKKEKKRKNTETIYFILFYLKTYLVAKKFASQLLPKENQ